MLGRRLSNGDVISCWRCPRAADTAILCDWWRPQICYTPRCDCSVTRDDSFAARLKPEKSLTHAWSSARWHVLWKQMALRCRHCCRRYRSTFNRFDMVFVLSTVLFLVHIRNKSNKRGSSFYIISCELFTVYEKSWNQHRVSSSSSLSSSSSEQTMGHSN